MVKTVEEIAREQDVVLQRKAGKPCNGLVRRYRPNITYAFLVIQQNGLFSGKYLVLVYQ